MPRVRVVLLCIGLVSCELPRQDAHDPPAGTGSRPQYFYRPRRVGSESLFDPIASSLNYALDSVQADSFNTDDLDDGWRIVRENLADPVHTIKKADGNTAFINTEIFPIDPKNIKDTQAALPNYALHLFGGGMLYRKQAEWLDANGYPAPYLTSGALSMLAELVLESSEKPVTDPTDEVADVWLFRPLGIWLFSYDDNARWVKETLQPVDWPHLLMYDVEAEDVLNVGVSYVARPQWFFDVGTRPFVYLGITTLFGLSHELDNGDTVSWGLGTSTETVLPTKLHFSGGLFYDRDDSLLASLIFNGTENLDVRANVYPGALLPSRYPLGLFLGLREDGDLAVGLQWGLPVGIAR